MTLFQRHMGRRVAAVGVAAALLVLGLDPGLRGDSYITSFTPRAARRAVW